ncbi:hypothetical protein G4X40_20170 [Rhodococcus sp. D2-41]|uniref:hypothetical protein n=1 Tax=Speluncibacter jeojiensis TaxID=2710754 RepID=UPI0024109855|nr:hypothetical protein [Rhodococcus sp. D2-41]MDG3012459.1 hypothetical protein [Rhodococcus sp. D2-41]
MDYKPTPRSDPNGLAGLLRSPQMRRLMAERGTVAQALYRQRVAKRTGDLARMVRVETFIGGRRKDRWCARVVAFAPHAASHEFGTSADGRRPQKGAHDWPAVLEQLRSR